MGKLKNLLGSGEKVNLQNIQYDFVTLASHQLRTPLSAVKWSCEILLAGRGGKLAKKQEEYLREIYRSNERAIGLVNDLLDVSRIQEGQIHLEVRPMQIEKIAEEIIDNHSMIIKTAGVSLDYQIVNGPLPLVQTDPDKLSRIMANLISNAIKYTPRGGKISVVLEKKGNNVSISISDTGVGIPKSEQAKVFGKFFRSHNILKLSPDGTGLGLFIVKSLVEIMGGKISFVSEEGKGTSFIFTLPLKS